ncbi:MAG: hypothetical protein JW829_10935, partial [Pirellulales bacterium]|nr:hypothetical protein [Pirellulales bacterium]
MGVCFQGRLRPFSAAGGYLARRLRRVVASMQTHPPTIPRPPSAAVGWRVTHGISGGRIREPVLK